ncbi:MAG TPA: glycosyltransferase 87 family protein [Propioniciclava sp.]|uniref:glycosyltransferase 87 family protein n=1 Tax=Propioniciclava sp. TaxID=2038686 RepID=UPI002B7B9CBD|nr:glycosyltransferase 87 family protein [Propioniciclava sp.]HRL79722.1 glycosyltransferase 87 family protein [Propioniciclava sp.]
MVLVAVAWLGAKALSCWWWVFRTGEYSDTYYYFLEAREAVATLAASPGSSAVAVLAQAMPEYPTPAAWLLLAPYLLGADDPTSYRNVIIAITIVADAWFAFLLARNGGPAGVLAWVAFTAALGGLPLLRLDMLPAVAAGAAVLLLVRRRGGRAGVAIALGTAWKVWPLILAPLLLAGRSRVRGFLALGVSGMLLALASVAAGGWERLFSPLTYQGERGLQIEAVAALGPMWDWGRGLGTHVYYSSFHAYEVGGPGVQEALDATRVAQVAAALVCVAVVVRWVLKGTPTRPVAWLALSLVGAFVVTSPALSPQYLLWLAPFVAVLLGQAAAGGPQAPPWGLALATAGLLAVLCVLTTIIYPVAYTSLLEQRSTTDAALLVLTARNLGLVVLTLGSLVAAWRFTDGNHRKRRLATEQSRLE